MDDEYSHRVLHIYWVHSFLINMFRTPDATKLGRAIPYAP